MADQPPPRVGGSGGPLPKPQPRPAPQPPNRPQLTQDQINALKEKFQSYGWNDAQIGQAIDAFKHLTGQR